MLPRKPTRVELKPEDKEEVKLFSPPPRPKGSAPLSPSLPLLQYDKLKAEKEKVSSLHSSGPGSLTGPGRLSLQVPADLPSFVHVDLRQGEKREGSRNGHGDDRRDGDWRRGGEGGRGWEPIGRGRSTQACRSGALTAPPPVSSEQTPPPAPRQSRNARIGLQQ